MYLLKKRLTWIKIIRIIGILIVTFIMNLSSVSADLIRIKADSWCPYNCQPDSLKPGYTIEVIKIIFEEKGHTIDYSTTIWTQALNLARRGAIEAVVGASKNEAKGFVFPEEEIGISTSSFFKKKELLGSLMD